MRVVRFDCEAKKKRAGDFAVRVLREVNIRSGAFSPDGEEERRWAREGSVEPRELTSVREALR